MFIFCSWSYASHLTVHCNQDVKLSLQTCIVRIILFENNVTCLSPLNAVFFFPSKRALVLTHACLSRKKTTVSLTVELRLSAFVSCSVAGTRSNFNHKMLYIL